ncbi:ABC transporter permease [Paenibacillus sp. FSL M7-1046]|uniref:ABC transporter permease n=1 Tax=Paenibacillus sp. FSL M7-1046 TaxID=2975315 RepID=UPI0030F9F9C4
MLSIAFKEIKQGVRDWGTMLFMLAFPIVLILILGLTLTNAFNSNVSIGNVKVIVKDMSANEPLSRAFSLFSLEADKSGIQMDPLQTGMNGREEVEKGRYASYIELKDSGIELYGSSRSTLESSIVQGMLVSFTDSYNAAETVSRLQPGKAELMIIDPAQRNYIQEVSIVPDRKPGSIDYYALAMTVMIGLWSAMPASGLIKNEITRGTAPRLMTAPLSKREMLTGKLMGSLVINMLCVLVLILFSKYVFNAYWGEHMSIVLGVLLSEVVMAISFGLAGSYILKGAASQGIIMIVLQIASLAGGAYFPVGDGGGLMGWVVKLSPIQWANHALTEVIYGNRLSAAWPVMGLNLGLAALFLGAAIVIMRHKEGM